jgi:hypothetical protein
LKWKPVVVDPNWANLIAYGGSLTISGGTLIWNGGTILDGGLFAPGTNYGGGTFSGVTLTMTNFAAYDWGAHYNQLGYDDGHTSGEATGSTDGYNDAFPTAYAAAFAIAFADGGAEGNRQGTDAGTDQGFSTGYSAMYGPAYDFGFNAGVEYQLFGRITVPAYADVFQSAAETSVPEPATCVLLSAGFCTVLLRRPRK